MKERIQLLLLLLLLPPLVASCAPAAGSPTPEPSAKGKQSDPPTTSPTPEPSATGTPSEPAPRDAAPPSSIPAEAAEPVRLAVEDLSRRTGIPPAQIQVQTVEAVDWRDSSLGCPEPGKAYAQVITPGYRIVLAAEGKTYRYHSDSGRRVISC